jgi:hypothetical protein
MLRKKNQAMLQIAFIRENQVINALAKEIWKPKVVLKKYNWMKTPSYASTARRNSSRI